jgi:hypothetical protein
MRSDGHGAPPSTARRQELARLLAAGRLTGQALRACPTGLG